jgi:hypothetical protein
VSALAPTSTGEAVGQDAAFEVATKLSLHVLCHTAAIIVLLAGTVVERSLPGLADAPCATAIRDGAASSRARTATALRTSTFRSARPAAGRCVSSRASKTRRLERLSGLYLNGTYA